jgi:hypothetical protein
MGTHQNDPMGGALFTLTHFRALRSTSHFPSYLFSSIANDTHIIGSPSIMSSTYEHFQIELHVISLFIQPYKCVAWSPSDMSLDFKTPPQFNTPLEGIKVLGVPLGTSSFTSSFIINVLLKDVQHVNILLKMSDV